MIDPSTGRLYVGGVNNLYDLHASGLGVKAHAVTGPEEDSHDCLSKCITTFFAFQPVYCDFEC